MSAPDPSAVVDERANSRFILDVDGSVAELVYRRVGTRLELIHTDVPEELGGRGIGGTLVRAAIEQARREGLTVVPSCPFARHWLDAHPDEAATVTIAWSR